MPPLANIRYHENIRFQVDVPLMCRILCPELYQPLARRNGALPLV